MSSLLEQAIVDAQALREAAIKSAENTILEKYSAEVREAVSSLLEQEEDEELELGDITGEVVDDDKEEEIVPDAAKEGEKLCPCPDDDEEIEVVFDDLVDLQKELPMGSKEEMPSDDMQQLEEEFELTEDMLSVLGEELDEARKPPIKKKDGGFVVRYNSDLEEYSVGKPNDPEEKLYYTSDKEDAMSTLKRMASDDDKMDEEIELTEENLEAIMEELVVDIKPQKRGWAGTPGPTMDYYAELELARLASTEAQQEIETMKAALSNIKKDYAQLSESFDSATGRNKKLAQTVSSLQEKLEEVTLTNARLFYTNRTLNSDSLNERQKNKIVEAISETRSVNEAKLVFETLQSAVGSSVESRGPKSLSEAVNRNSPLMARRESSSSAERPVVERLQRLAGIKKL